MRSTDGRLAAIELDGVFRTFNRTAVLNGLSFAVNRGAVTCLLGRDGAGKTTALRVLLGLLPADSGRALVNGARYGELPDPAFTVGAVLDHCGAHPARRGLDHLRIVAAAAGIPDSRVGAVLDQVGLRPSASCRVRRYSPAMRQRLAIAAALLGDPEILILDEPTNGLDPAGVHWLRGLLRRRADAGHTVLISSPQLAETRQLADEVVVIDRGRLVHHGASRELLTVAGAAIKVRCSSGPALLAALVDASISAERLDVDTIVAYETDEITVGNLALACGVAVYQLVSQDPLSLESMFLRLALSEPEPVPAPDWKACGR